MGKKERQDGIERLKTRRDRETQDNGIERLKTNKILLTNKIPS